MRGRTFFPNGIKKRLEIFSPALLLSLGQYSEEEVRYDAWPRAFGGGEEVVLFVFALRRESSVSPSPMALAGSKGVTG